jgi:hypothetical protein
MLALLRGRGILWESEQARCIHSLQGGECSPGLDSFHDSIRNTSVAQKVVHGPLSAMASEIVIGSGGAATMPGG